MPQNPGMDGVIISKKLNLHGRQVIGSRSSSWAIRLLSWMILQMTLLSDLCSLKVMPLWGSGSGPLNYRRYPIEYRRVTLDRCFAGCGSASKRRQLKAAALRPMGVSKGWNEAPHWTKSETCFPVPDN